MDIILFNTDITLSLLIFYFLIYSFLGWAIEVLYSAIKKRQFINRGFLNGPICPLYGLGALLVTLVTFSFKENIFLIFIVSLALTSLIEFLTGFILMKLFGRKWWDYSDRRLNIKGYICLEFSLLWGVLCVCLVVVFNEGFLYIYSLFHQKVMLIIITSLLIVFVIDIVLSVINITKYKNRFKILALLSEDIKKPGDIIGQGIFNTYEKAHEKYNELIMKIKESRISKAFPNLIKNISDKFKDNEKK